MDDNYSLWERHEVEEEKLLEQLPKCDICGEPILGEYLWKIGWRNYCEECIDDCKQPVEVDF